jgi:drug/metabolite transporter (DMT)-like permease
MDNLRGALLMILSMAGFAIEDAFVKTVLGRGMPIGQVFVFLGLAGGLAFALLAIRRGRCATSLAFFHPAVLARNAGEIIGTSAYVTALTLIPLSLLGALLQAVPIFVVLGAILFLGERVGWRRWGAIAAGLAGVLIILRPGAADFDPNALWGLLGALGIAARDVVTRRVPVTIHPLQLGSWGFFMLVPVGAVMLSLSGGAIRPGTTEIWLLLGALALGMAGYHALTLAVGIGEIAYVTPFRYTRLVFALAIGAMLFGEHLDRTTLAGAGLVVGAGIYTLWRERRNAARRPFQSQPPSAMTGPHDI